MPGMKWRGVEPSHTARGKLTELLNDKENVVECSTWALQKYECTEWEDDVGQASKYMPGEYMRYTWDHKRRHSEQEQKVNI